MLKKLKKIPLSNKQIVDSVFYPIEFIIYRDFNNYDSIDEAFNGKKSILILYLQTESFGHWTCLIKLKNNLIEFFDPYGYVIDKGLKFNNKNLNDHLGQRYPYLSELLVKSKYNLSYNNFSFQRKGSNINTCGRHCIVRMNNNNLSLKRYKQIFDSLEKKHNLNPDDVVTILTQNNL